MQIVSITNIFKSNKSNFYFGIVATIILAYGLFLNMIQPGVIDLDTAICGAVANKNIHQGGLYISAWENKPPGLIYLLQALIFIFCNNVYTFFGLALFSAIVLSLGFYFLIYKYTQSILITILFCAFAFSIIFYPQFYGFGLYTELFCTIFLVYALVFYEYSTIKYNIYYAALFAGFSFWFKEPCLLAALAILGLLVYKNKEKTIRLKLLLFFTIPSVLFIILLIINGSLSAFIAAIQYNFLYINAPQKITLYSKLLFFNQHFLLPSFALIIGFTLICIWLYKNKKLNFEHLFFILIILSSSLFFIISPYNFGHYYLTFVTLIFIFIAKFYETYKLQIKSNNSLLILIIFYFTYQSINENIKPEFTYKINNYQPNNISKKLLAEPTKTLFIDYVNAADYFIKGNKIHPTFVPIALPVHFGNSANGLKNRERIWHEMNHPKPDFLITTHTTSYFYWFLPHNGFYEKNYEKIDSTTDKDNFVVYLWQLKKK